MKTNSQKKARIARKTLDSYIALGRDRCEKCGRTDMLTIDHIVPISVLFLAGFSMEEVFDDKYITILCRICNQQKAARLDFTDKRTKSILMGMVDKVWGLDK